MWLQGMPHHTITQALQVGLAVCRTLWGRAAGHVKQMLSTLLSFYTNTSMPASVWLPGIGMLGVYGRAAALSKGGAKESSHEADEGDLAELVHKDINACKRLAAVAGDGREPGVPDLARLRMQQHGFQQPRAASQRVHRRHHWQKPAQAICTFSLTRRCHL